MKCNIRFDKAQVSEFAISHKVLTWDLRCSEAITEVELHIHAHKVCVHFIGSSYCLRNRFSYIAVSRYKLVAPFLPVVHSYISIDSSLSMF